MARMTPAERYTRLCNVVDAAAAALIGVTLARIGGGQ